MLNHEAIYRAYPNAATINDSTGAFDADGNQIVLDEFLVQVAIAQLDAERAATQYQRDRQPEYPDLAVLADALYWSNQGDNTKLDEYYAACSAVKAKYPKP
jgi:hypothetical protein